MRNRSHSPGAEGAEAETDPGMSKRSQEDLAAEGAEAEVATGDALLQVAITPPLDPVMREHLPIKS